MATILAAALPSTLTASEPVGLAAMKRHLRMDLHDDDEYLSQELIPAAREFVENEVCGGRHLRQQAYTYTDGGFPADTQGRLELPIGPLYPSVAVGYVDTDGSTQTWASTNYTVMRDAAKPGYIVPSYGKAWPATRSQDDAVQIKFVVGYDSTDVPARAKHMVKLVAGDWYENRENQIVGTISAQIALGVDRLARSLGWGCYA